MEQEPKIEDPKIEIQKSLIRIRNAASKITSMLETPTALNEATLREFAEEIVDQANIGANALSKLEQ
ncbi:MAG: hypothetical protein A3J46_03610 [Candidatus Yanofskybacteria bacterium RIFCSPHIGHO2_02_FULL_41_11]|uniref:Uncharacterized protein n=1 Tax=Candidatus Yanofskybacteria bacterium RIFCSPHIGHO2_02_FULL_41_11 TaxID=1802675 RepID=A0A1F8F7P9_9BACT|nr:MAG: hypothetical protein A3J46_03610 [Candidatus Yanofskybacteria bacterium RIFCSPHIGHO2_02_FULL_41_11]